jgi:hypothetical protein
MESWWDLGEGHGYQGNELADYQITCAFCQERGNWDRVAHFEKKQPNSEKRLNFDTLECGNCRGYVLVMWSAGDRLHNYEVLPWPLRLERYPEHWPEAVGRYWLQAKRNLRDQNWDAAALMARSALQVAFRESGAEGRTLKQEAEDLAAKGILPPIMRDWSDHVRELGNDAAHPGAAQSATNPQDARDIVRFLDFLLGYLYTLPHEIEKYRERTEGEE